MQFKDEFISIIRKWSEKCTSERSSQPRWKHACELLQDFKSLEQKSLKQINELIARLDEVEIKNKKLVKRNTDLLERLNELEQLNVIEETEDDNTEMLYFQEQLNILSSENAELKEENKKLKKSNVEELRTQNEMLKEENKKLTGKYISLGEKNISLLNETSKYQEKIDSLYESSDLKEENKKIKRNVLNLTSTFQDFFLRALPIFERLDMDMDMDINMGMDANMQNQVASCDYFQDQEGQDIQNIQNNYIQNQEYDQKNELQRDGRIQKTVGQFLLESGWEQRDRRDKILIKLSSLPSDATLHTTFVCSSGKKYEVVRATVTDGKKKKIFHICSVPKCPKELLSYIHT